MINQCKANVEPESLVYKFMMGMMGKLKDRKGRWGRPVIFVAFACDGKVKNANVLTWPTFELHVTSMMDGWRHCIRVRRGRAAERTEQTEQTGTFERKNKEEGKRKKFRERQ